MSNCYSVVMFIVNVSVVLLVKKGDVIAWLAIT